MIETVRRLVSFLRRSVMKLPACALALLTAATLGGCAGAAKRPGQRAEHIHVSTSAFLVDPALEDTIRLYVAMLGDQSFQSTYGHDDQTWYIAAERLGQIGAPAVPHLMAVLGTADAYAEMLALYALMLAVQDTAVLSRTGREPIGYHSVLSGSDNVGNRRQALKWWVKHRHLWGHENPVSDSAALRR